MKSSPQGAVSKVYSRGTPFTDGPTAFIPGERSGQGSRLDMTAVVRAFADHETNLTGSYGTRRSQANYGSYAGIRLQDQLPGELHQIHHLS